MTNDHINQKDVSSYYEDKKKEENEFLSLVDSAIQDVALSKFADFQLILLQDGVIEVSDVGDVGAPSTVGKIFNRRIKNFSFDSRMLDELSLSIGSYRNLEVDQRFCLPLRKHILALVTASDVLHSQAIPSFGIKIDACPGRLNATNFFIKRDGIFYGQCSEICGIGHSFMPIAIRVDLNVDENSKLF